MTSGPTDVAPAPPAAAPEAVPERPRLMLVGASPGVHKAIERWAAELGAELTTAADLPRAVRRLASERWDVVIAVLGADAAGDMTWWRDALREHRSAPHLVLVVDGPSPELVLEASRSGADVLSSPPGRAEFLRAVERVRSVVAERPVPLVPVPALTVGAHALVGQSPAMLEVYRVVARVAPSTATVLIEGESGSGKEVIARFIHANAPNANGPFVPVNCAAIPETLLESELFGHEKGSFTGAVARKIGRVQQADGGTLFLDEVADMSLALQAKILRAVQEREIERVGGTESISINIRLIAATNRDVDAAVREQRLREDLYYRLAVVRIRLPTLSQRGDDIDLLTAHFTRHYSDRYRKRITAISDLALDLLRRHRWVGNVRELQNVIERAVIVAGDDTIRAQDLPDELRGPAVEVPAVTDGLTLAAVEARHIAHILAQTNGHIGAAAQILGIHRNTLARKMREYRL